MTVSCAEPTGSGGSRWVLIGGLGGSSVSPANGLLEVTPMSKKEVWTMSTLSASDWPVQPPDWAGFRMFPRDPRKDKAGNRVRVPPRARHNPFSEGFLLLSVDKC